MRPRRSTSSPRSERGPAAPAASASAKAFAAIDHHESALRAEIEAGLAALDGISVYSRAASRTPTLLVDFADREAAEVSRHLATLGVNAPSGSFYALEASRHLGLGDDGALRIGLAPYTDRSDVERLLTGIASAMDGPSS